MHWLLLLPILLGGTTPPIYEAREDIRTVAQESSQVEAEVSSEEHFSEVEEKSHCKKKKQEPCANNDTSAEEWLLFVLVLWLIFFKD